MNIAGKTIAVAVQPKLKFMRTVFCFFCLRNRPQRPPHLPPVLPFLPSLTHFLLHSRSGNLTNQAQSSSMMCKLTSRQAKYALGKSLWFSKKEEDKTFWLWKETELKGAEEVFEVLSYNWPRILDQEHKYHNIGRNTLLTTPDNSQCTKYYDITTASEQSIMI